MRIAIIQFPGSNCERETMLAVKRANMLPEPFLWCDSPEKLSAFDGYIIVGGFSYEDRSRSGIIAALDPIVQILKKQSDLGKPLLGICNGAQILVEAGLVPGIESNAIELALTDNKRIKQGKVLGTGYYNAWINIQSNNKKTAFTRLLAPNQIIRIPVAHAQGRFILSESLSQQIQKDVLGIMQYCDKEGKIIDEFPINPNGSCQNIASIANKAGNVMAMMPHPERTDAGDIFFHSMRDYIENAEKCPNTLSKSPKISPARKNYRLPHQNQELIVELAITDNQAYTVENTLKKLGIPVQIKRQIHWQIGSQSKSILHQIQASGVLYNERKETVAIPQKQPGQRMFLVKPKEDILGLQKLQTLKKHFEINALESLSQGILWTISGEESSLNTLVDKVFQTKIIFNSLTHECFEYV